MMQLFCRQGRLERDIAELKHWVPTWREDGWPFKTQQDYFVESREECDLLALRFTDVSAYTKAEPRKAIIFEAFFVRDEDGRQKMIPRQWLNMKLRILQAETERRYWWLCHLARIQRDPACPGCIGECPAFSVSKLELEHTFRWVAEAKGAGDILSDYTLALSFLQTSGLPLRGPWIAQERCDQTVSFRWNKRLESSPIDSKWPRSIWDVPSYTAADDLPPFLRTRLHDIADDKRVPDAYRHHVLDHGTDSSVTASHMQKWWIRLRISKPSQRGLQASADAPGDQSWLVCFLDT